MPSAAAIRKASRGTYAPQSIFRQNATKVARAADQTPAKRLANQLFYSTPTATAGAFYGYAGMGYAGNAEGANTLLKTSSYNVPLWTVKGNQPRIKVWTFKNGAPNTEGDRGIVQEDLDRNGGVPLPTLALTHKGQLGAFGTDEWAVVWCPETDESWEFIGLTLKTEGEYAGRWICSNAHYQAGVSTWSGITAGHSGQGCAAGLGLGCGIITNADLLRVARGGKIDHALAVTAIVLEDAFVAPARLNDSAPNTKEKLADGTTPNPAFGTVDQVPEGTWCVFPAASRASDFGMTRKLEIAIYEAIREYGVFVWAKGGTCNFVMADPMTLFTPYCDVVTHPLKGSSGFGSYPTEGTTEAEREGWIDPSLPALNEGSLSGTAGLLAKMPWRTLELLEPRSS